MWRRIPGYGPERTLLLDNETRKFKDTPDNGIVVSASLLCVMHSQCPTAWYAHVKEWLPWVVLVCSSVIRKACHRQPLAKTLEHGLCMHAPYGTIFLMPPAHAGAGCPIQ